MNDPQTPPEDQHQTEDAGGPEATAATPAPDPESPGPSDESFPAPEPESDLPEWEPLTPELVEDEAIRGDFMLRWAVILLALLMGWTIIQDTSVLTHIKSGQVSAAEGFWLVGTDHLSATGADLTWVNLSWMWDLTAAGIYAVAGLSGVSVVTGILAALCFWLLARVTLPGLPTWWGSVCSALALIAAFPSLTATPALITLLGMAALLVWLGRALRSPDASPLWQPVVLIAVWNQFDDRAWIGVLTLLAVALGRWFDTVGQDATSPRRLGKVAGLSLLVMLAHPFLWHSLLSPIAMYQLDYPAWQAYGNPGEPFSYEWFPIWSDAYWRISYFNGAGMLLWLATAVTLVLNAARLSYSQAILFAVSTVLAACGGRELAVAGLINAAVANLNAQEWYRESFRQTYSVETMELLFSRGGRAITVIVFFFLGFSVVGGQLMGAGGRRVGMGLDPQLTQTIESYKDVLSESFDDRPFNFRLDQGDILNWIGQRPFIDSRVRLFAAGSPSLVDEHLEIRVALRSSREGADAAADARTWQTAFNRYQITHVVPRLSGTSPDYVTFRDLRADPNWTMTKLGAATAAFYRTDGTSEKLSEYVAANRAASMVEQQFRSRDPSLSVTETRTSWPQAPSVYDRYVYLPRPRQPNALQLARHYASLAGGPQSSSGMNLDEVTAMLQATVRQIHRGLAESPSDPQAYLLQGEVYWLLWRLESSVVQSAGLVYASPLRYAQTTSAFHHAIASNPQNASAHHQLFSVYNEFRRDDLALHHLQQLRSMTGRLTTLDELHPNYLPEQERLSQLLEGLTGRVEAARLQLAEDLAAGADRLFMAQSLSQAGLPQLALETLEEDLTAMSGNAAATQLYGQLLLENGRTRDAHDHFQRSQSLTGVQQLPGWAIDTAKCEVVAGELTAAVRTLTEDADLIAKSSTAMLMGPGPLHSVGLGGDELIVDPLSPAAQRTQLAGVYVDQLHQRLEENRLVRAMIHLEFGLNDAANGLLETLLEENPGTPLRPVVEMYLNLLADRSDQPLPPVPDEETLTYPDLTASPAELLDEGEATKDADAESNPATATPQEESGPGADDSN